MQAIVYRMSNIPPNVILSPMRFTRVVQKVGKVVILKMFGNCAAHKKAAQDSADAAFLWVLRYGSYSPSPTGSELVPRKPRF